jgi:hypothetical protein
MVCRPLISSGNRLRAAEISTKVHCNISIVKAKSMRESGHTTILARVLIHHIFMSKLVSENMTGGRRSGTPFCQSECSLPDGVSKQLLGHLEPLLEPITVLGMLASFQINFIYDARFVRKRCYIFTSSIFPIYNTTKFNFPNL